MPRIVEIKDQTPLLIKPEDTVNGIVAVCRCGLSSNWPFCNGTHKATIGEDPAKLYHYDRELPQGTPRRHEIDLGELEKRSREESQKQEDPAAPESQEDGHGAGATPVRPPRPAPQHANPSATPVRETAPAPETREP
jgi:CDGSH-type Zn-finger protein